MKKQFIISLCFILDLLIGFVTGRSSTYVKSTSYEGTYTEKNLQNDAGPFQIVLSAENYQYFDPVTDKSGKGSYEVLDDGIIIFTSGSLKGITAISEKQFMKDTTLTLLDSSDEKTLVFIKSE